MSKYKQYKNGYVNTETDQWSFVEPLVPSEELGFLFDGLTSDEAKSLKDLDFYDNFNFED